MPAWLLTSILATKRSCCLMRRKTESKASWWASWLRRVKAERDAESRLWLVPFSCSGEGGGSQAGPL